MNKGTRYSSVWLYLPAAGLLAYGLAEYFLGGESRLFVIALGIAAQAGAEQDASRRSMVARLNGDFNMALGLRALRALMGSLGVVALWPPISSFPLPIPAPWLVAGGALLYLRLRWKLHRHLGGWPALSDAAILLEYTNQLEVALREAAAGEVYEAERIHRELSDSPLYGLYPGAKAGAQIAVSRWIATLGREDLAEADLREAAEYYRKVGVAASLAEAKVALAERLGFQERFAEAEEEYRGALEVGGNRMFRLNYVIAKRGLAMCLAMRDLTGEAIHIAREAAETSERFKIYDVAAQSHLLLAGLASQADDLPTAFAALAASRRCLDSGDGNLATWRIYYQALAETYQSADDLEPALASYVRAAQYGYEERRRLGLRSAQAAMASRTQLALLGPSEVAVALAESGNDFGGVGLQMILSAQSASDLGPMMRQADVLELLQGSDEDPELARAARAIAGPQESSGEAVQGRDPHDSIEARISSVFRHALPSSQIGDSEAPNFQNANYAVLQCALIDGESSGALSICGWFAGLGLSTTPFLSQLHGPSLETLRSLLSLGVEAPTSARSSLRAGDGLQWYTSSRFKALATLAPDQLRDLGEALIPAPLLRHLDFLATDGRVPRLLIVPDATLWALPWAALRVGPDATALVRRVTICYLPSLSLMPVASNVERGTSLAVYSHGVDEAGVALEEAAAAEAFGSKLLKLEDPEDVKSGLLTGTISRECMVLSLSVHGFDSPGLAHSLALTEDISLSGLDIMRAVFPRILMLNACFSTSLDPRRGVEPVGLGTLALCRGAEAVVGGQFPLPDGEDDEYGFATSAIVASVYQSLSRGDDLAESVRSAQAEWLNEHPDAPPFWWAGWMVLEAPRGE